MNPRYVSDVYSKFKKNFEDICSIRELEDKIFELKTKQNYILNCGLSKEVESLAIKELEEQKKELKELMHKKVDQL